VDFPSSDVLSVLNYLLPGLVATWAFRRVTPHDKPKDLDALIEALLFTAAVQPLVLVIQAAALAIGTSIGAIGAWTDDVALVLAVVLGLCVGLASGVAANKDWVHAGLRRWKLTKQTSFPSEWYRHLFCEERFVILTMRNGDRIRGWPAEFPNSPDRGHFCLRGAEWLPQDEPPQVLATAEAVLIPASDVMYLEFLKFEQEMTNEQKGSSPSG
jgi:hypothetical protein